VTARLDRALAILALAVLPFLIHGRAIADGLIVAVGLLFLARSALAGDWAWLRALWVRLAAAWWLWIVATSAPEGLSVLGGAVAVGRFPLFVAALEFAALRDARTRRWLAGLAIAAAAYIAAQAWWQFAFGRNWFGFPRFGDGELTGPYANPRAAGPLARLLPPAALSLPLLVPAGAALLLGAATIVVIGQRMPLLLTVLALAAIGLLLPRLRLAALAALALGAALLAASPVIAPQAYWRLIEKFSAQMSDFGASHYGRILERGTAIAAQHPFTGRGFEAFRRHCADPRYFSPGTDAALCVTHPHNPYLQALTDGGIPGLVLFALLAGAWLGRLWPGWRTARPVQAGLFAAALMHLWPIQSAGGFHLLPLAGFFFLLLGWGLAERRHGADTI
jgi:O-antigen ligase